MEHVGSLILLIRHSKFKNIPLDGLYDKNGSYICKVTLHDSNDNCQLYTLCVMRDDGMIIK